MLDIREVAVWAGGLMSVFALVAFILRPVLKMMEG